MPPGLRVAFSITAVVLMSAASWTLRPGQPRPVHNLWFRLAYKDPFFYCFFNSEGYPRRYSWAAPLIVGALFIAVVWLLPTP
jgi:hypothetical protein